MELKTELSMSWHSDTPLKSSHSNCAFATTLHVTWQNIGLTSLSPSMFANLPFLTKATELSLVIMTTKRFLRELDNQEAEVWNLGKVIPMKNSFIWRSLLCASRSLSASSWKGWIKNSLNFRFAIKTRREIYREIKFGINYAKLFRGRMKLVVVGDLKLSKDFWPLRTFQIATLLRSPNEIINFPAHIC